MIVVHDLCVFSAVIPGTTEVNPKLCIPSDSLAQYLQSNHGLHQGEPLLVRQFKHGQSNPTYYVEYGGEKLVLRKKPVNCMKEL